MVRVLEINIDTIYGFNENLYPDFASIHATRDPFHYDLRCHNSKIA